jgi:hypothetical protein
MKLPMVVTPLGVMHRVKIASGGRAALHATGNNSLELDLGW